jgi:hypothetical protein
MSDLPQKPSIAEFHVGIGETVKFSKTVSESDIYLFAGIRGCKPKPPKIPSGHFGQHFWV